MIDSYKLLEKSEKTVFDFYLNSNMAPCLHGEVLFTKNWEDS